MPVIGKPADGINAAWYAAEGDELNAALSAGAMIPVAGVAFTGGKAVIKGVDAAKAAPTPRPRQFVTTPRGTTFDIPPGWVSREANNGRGIVFQRSGASGNADSIRIMEPTDRYPNGYFVYYDQHGFPLDVQGNSGVPRSEYHIPEDYQGPLPRWPR